MTIAPVVDRLRAWAALVLPPTGPLPRPTVRNYVFDAVLALVVGIASVRYAVDSQDVPARVVVVGGLLRPVPLPPPPQPGVMAGAVVIAVVGAVALALRRRYPLAVLWVVLYATSASPSESPGLTFYACVIAAYSAAAYSPHRWPALASLLVAVLVVAVFRDSELPVVPNEYVPLLVLVPLIVAANGLRTWKVRTDEGRAQVSALEREQAEALHRAVEHERARIARELHDVVTHHVSVMTIQAGAARKVMASSPGQAREALLAVEAGGRAAMTELRHVMGLLAADGADPADLAPQPGLDQLAALVARLRDSGVPVESTVSGQPRPLPSGVELAAYRVVQEALTNAVKHASGGSAAVTVVYGADHLRVEVVDTGGEPGPGAAAGDGHGLIGLRERLAVYGGTLDARPRAGGGYHVTASIPVQAP
ncbi:sensor histidine kinase [Saccharothrix sp. 6-C]|uniref:sensor histidine kinase n=1 Tax=Saccharothrix sp. 6-C TaxID=2781735 RepID=UPI001AF82E19|nr:sensor histidine kinase [Saccharothrix sp. 6-C]QQQ74319.1 sensor histidine kinase [Saccharothrix sp. 6-C]